MPRYPVGYPVRAPGRRGGLGEDCGMIGVKSELNGDLMAVGFIGKGVYLSYAQDIEARLSKGRDDVRRPLEAAIPKVGRKPKY